MRSPTLEPKGAVLIISRNRDLEFACRQALEPRKFSVLSARSLPEGMEKMGANIDVVLLDGVRPLFLLLQRQQAVTMFSQVFRPPLAMGTT